MKLCAPGVVRQGGGWTGLNLTPIGCEPGENVLLTYLTIPAMLFGTNLTAPRAFRAARNGEFLNEISRALLMFRQSIGQLV